MTVWEFLSKLFYDPTHIVMFVMFLIMIILVLRVTGFSWVKGKGFRFRQVVKLDEKTQGIIDPKAPCPYTESKARTHSRIDNLECKFTEMSQTVIDMKTEVDKVLSMVSDLAIDQQKQLFCNGIMPTEERLIAGLRYIEKGHNGAMKKQIIEFVQENQDMYKAIVMLQPKLKLKELGD